MIMDLLNLYDLLVILLFGGALLFMLFWGQDR
jgi:hypothetical protein